MHTFFEVIHMHFTVSIYQWIFNFNKINITLVLKDWTVCTLCITGKTQKLKDLFQISSFTKAVY